MLIRKLLETRKADAELPVEIRAALVHSLFASTASLVAGAVACSVIGMAASIRAGDPWIMRASVAILTIGMLRVASALAYKRSKRAQRPEAAEFWGRLYEWGAWAFSGSLGLLCFLTIIRTDDASLQMAVCTTAAGYAAAISGRNAGRPFVAVGQLTLTSLPMAIALLAYPDWVHKTLGLVVIMFIYGMMDITLGIRDVIIQALTMTRKEAALKAQFEQQARRFDIAITNMSHGLCMLDQDDCLQVWNARFQELLNLQNVPLRVGMPLHELARHCIRVGRRRGYSLRRVFADLARALRHNSFEQVQISLDGQRTIALSRRLVPDGGSVLLLEDVTERKRAQERIAHLARFDDLTGLANRSQFRERIDALLDAVPGSGKHIALHLIDLDRFKAINDTLGHPLGDKLLKEVAARLRAIGPAADTITRFGGDEFVVLQIASGDGEDIDRLAKELISILGCPFEIEGHRIDIGASIGVAVAPLDGTDADQLLQKADMALYAAKSSGGGNHCFFAPEMEEAAQGRRALELDLREALASSQFHLEFQPLVDLRSGRVTTCEALVRWRHPTRGLVPPSVFIPVAEETGLIVALGEWVLHRACHEAASWPPDVKVSVNLSPVQFRDGGLALQVISALTKAGLPSWRLDLEITERVLLDDSERTLLIMEELKNLGVAISLDDFGTGYSSLNYLRKYPFDKIKIDRSFVHDLGQERTARAIVHAIASLGAALDKIVVAEGVETEEQVALVRAQGCHEGQGYFFSRPVTADATRAKLEAMSGKAPLVGAQRVA